MPFFNKNYLQFLKGLSENNNKEWFDENRKSYNDWVKRPFNEFVQLMIDKIQAHDNRVVVTPKDCIFRINRDIRFSADKTPYKTHMSALIGAGGKKDKSIPGIYFHFGTDNVSVYGGAHMLSKEQLHKVRQAIAFQPEEFQSLIKQPDFVSKFGSIQGEENKRLPKEFTAAAERQPLIYKKSFYFFHKAPAETVLMDNLDDWIMDFVHTARPINDFFFEAMA